MTQPLLCIPPLKESWSGKSARVMFTGVSASSADAHLEAGKFSHFVTEASVHTLVTRMVNEYSRAITKEYKVIVRVLAITARWYEDDVEDNVIEEVDD